MLKNTLKRFLPPSSKTVNTRLDSIEQLLNTTRLIQRNAEALYYSCWANVIHDTHKETFGPFKGIHKGNELVILGSGPSLNFFQPFDEATYIGVNNSYKKDDIKLDYIFIQDFQPGHLYDLEELKKIDCIKFFGKHCTRPNHYVNADVPEYLIEEIEAKKYFVNHIYGPAGNTPIMADLEYFPIMDCWTTSFSALEFAFFTHPKTIYLVGLDTSVKLGGHYNDSTILVEEQEERFAESIKGYRKVKQFADSNYPDIRIISINPVGLRGIFEDVYTKNFLDAYPEIMSENENNYTIFDRKG